MKKIIFNTLLALFCFEGLFAQDTLPFKPSIKFGAFLQTQAVFTQDRPANPAQDANRKWGTQIQIWRARVLAEGKFSPKTSFFMQTEISNPIGIVQDSAKQIQQANLILLDAQIEHAFSKNFLVYAGMQLTGANRQGLQSPVSLMGLEFGWYQYPYNLFATQALQNNFGRDLGLSLRAYALKERLEIRAGVFRGRARTTYENPRFNLRLNYNFWETEKEHYYSGTYLGKKKILAWGGGIDWQDQYLNLASDLFVDLPTSNGAFTLQMGYMYLSGGNSAQAQSYTALVPDQHIVFGEMGYFFRKSQLQGYLKYEIQQFDISTSQYQINTARQTESRFSAKNSTQDRQNFNTFFSESRFGAGLNYYPYGFNFHLKLQYEQIFYGRFRNPTSTEVQSGGEIKFQITCFLF